MTQSGSAALGEQKKHGEAIIGGLIKEVYIVARHYTPLWWWPVAGAVLALVISGLFINIPEWAGLVIVAFGPANLAMAHVVMLKVEHHDEHRWNNDWYLRIKTGILFVIVNLVVLALLGAEGQHYILDSTIEYISTVAYLGGVIYCSIGLGLRISFSPTPLMFTLVIGAGLVLASFVSTIAVVAAFVPSIGLAMKRLDYHPKPGESIEEAHVNGEKLKKKMMVVLSVLTIYLLGNAGGMIFFRGELPSFLLFQRGVPFYFLLFRMPIEWVIANIPVLFLFWAYLKYQIGRNFVPAKIKFAIHVYDWQQLPVLVLITILDLTYLESIIHAPETILLLVKSMAVFIIVLMSRNMNQKGMGTNPLVDIGVDVDRLFATIAAFFFVVFLTMGGTLYFFHEHGADMTTGLSKGYQLLGFSEEQAFLIAYHQIGGLASSGVDNAPIAKAQNETAQSPNALELYSEYEIVGGAPLPLQKANHNSSILFGVMFVFSNITNVAALLLLAQLGIHITPKEYVGVTKWILVVLLISSIPQSYMWLADKGNPNSTQPITNVSMVCDAVVYQVPVGTVPPSECELEATTSDGH